MQMILYNNKSDNRELNKTLVQLSTVEIKLKNDDEIVNPLVILSGAYLPPSANYAYVAALSRYYYINGQRIMPGNQLELSLKVDVLMSWQAVIKKAQVIASRSTNKPNKQIPDQIPLLTKRNVIYKRLEGGIYERGGFGSDVVTSLTPSILLSVINGRGETPNTPVLSLVSKLDTVIALSWTSIDGATKYQLQRKDPTTGVFGLVTETTSTTHSDTVPGFGTYVYRVRAISDLAQGAFSNELTVTAEEGA